MIEVQTDFELREFLESEVLPRHVLDDWRDGIKRNEAKDCPPEVREFINALNAKLADFIQIGKERGSIKGYELHLAGMKEYQGEVIDRWTTYELQIPRMIAVDNEKAMHRIYHRRGKQGLISFVKAKVKGTELERLLEILNVHVFKQEREEFKKVLREINASKKLDSI